MLQKKFELRQRMGVGDIVTLYFDFLKQNIKQFTNIFISYNGIFILAFLGISYLLITGFVGMANDVPESESLMYIGFGGFAFFVVFVIVASLNYSLSAAYVSNYSKSETIEVEKKEVWKQVKDNVGNIILFVLLLILIYVGYTIVSLILAIIPIIGSIAQSILNFAISGWFGVSFMVMLHGKQSISNSFSEGWQLVYKNFWKTVGVNFIIGILNAILLLLVLSIPGILIGFYAFHAVDSGVDLANSSVAKVIWIIALWIFLILITFSQSLSQFANGILYFSLHEQTYNEYTRAKIEQIGQDSDL
ncbi:MAG: hypothetical protein QM499_06000 [Flavobacteriaceae bacterium]